MIAYIDRHQDRFGGAICRQLQVTLATLLGFDYVAFVVDAFTDRIAGWRVKTTKDAALVLHALDQAPSGNVCRPRAPTVN